MIDNMKFFSFEFLLRSGRAKVVAKFRIRAHFSK